MARSRLMAIAALAIAVSVAQQQTAHAQVIVSEPAAAPVRSDATCVVYPLSGIGHDPSLAQWVAETIPSAVEPDSWRVEGMTITYHAPCRVLVVRQTPAVHAKVKAFLADLKNAAREEKDTIHLRKPPVVQAEYTEAVPQKTPQAAAAGYPVPAPQSQPKHLFHLILRYEGDGLPETAVESVVKQVTDAAAVDKGDGEPRPKSEPAKGPSLGQLLHFIVRYEGDGIIDANVVQLLKELNKDGGQRWTSPVSPVAGSPACSPYNNSPSPSTFAPVSGPTPPSAAPVPLSSTYPSSGVPAAIPATQPGTNPAQGTSLPPQGTTKPGPSAQ